MKLFLHSANATKFTTNGFGALTDAYEAKVHEVLNGEYELEFAYPIGGLHYEDIADRRIVTAKVSDETIQAFRIYRIVPNLSKIDVYAHHISYDLSGIIMPPIECTSLSDVISKIKSKTVNNKPFAFSTDKDDNKKEFSIKCPKSVRSVLGGDEDSVLAAFEGEYLFDNFNVKLMKRRGYDNGVTIRYGKNLSSFEMDRNIENVYTAVYPYWFKDLPQYESETVVEASSKTATMNSYAAENDASEGEFSSEMPTMYALNFDELKNFNWQSFIDGIKSIDLSKPIDAWKNIKSKLASVGIPVAPVEEIIKEIARKRGIDIDGLIQQYGSFENSLNANWLTKDILGDSLNLVRTDDGPSYVELEQKIINAEGEFDFSRILVLDLSTEWEYAPLSQELEEAAKKYISDNKISEPDISWNISHVALEQTDEYRGMNLLEKLEMGDSVSVIFPKIKVNTTARVVETTWDPILERYDSVTLGKVKSDLASTIYSNTKDVEEQTIVVGKKPSRGEVKNINRKLTETLLGADGGSVRLLDTSGNGAPDTLYIADDPDPDKAKFVWRFNYEGWGASKNGYDGPFTIGATIRDSTFTAGVVTGADETCAYTLDSRGLLYKTDDNSHLRVSAHVSKADQSGWVRVCYGNVDANGNPLSSGALKTTLGPNALTIGEKSSANQEYAYIGSVGGVASVLKLYGKEIAKVGMTGELESINGRSVGSHCVKFNTSAISSIGAEVLVSGMLSNDKCEFYEILGKPSSSAATVSMIIPSAAITTTPVNYQIADENNYVTFKVYLTELRFVSISIVSKSSSGSVDSVYGFYL